MFFANAAKKNMAIARVFSSYITMPDLSKRPPPSNLAMWEDSHIFHTSQRPQSRGSGVMILLGSDACTTQDFVRVPP